MLKANFQITESGGTGVVQLQYSDDQGISWQNTGSPLTLANGALAVNDNTNVLIDTAIFVPGEIYAFRLVDVAGGPISNFYITQIPVIESYVAGTATIGFSSTGGDNYEVGFSASPDTLDAPPGVTQTNIKYKVIFWSGLVSTTIIDTPPAAISDQTVTTGAHGAGVYQCEIDYIFSNNFAFSSTRFVRVDGSGTIIYDVQCKGINVNSVSGLDIDLSFDVVRTGGSWPSGFIGYADGTLSVLSYGVSSAVLTLSPATSVVFGALDLDPDFLDMGGDLFGCAMNIGFSH